MSGWQLFWLVTRRDLVERGKSKSYLISTGFTLALFLGFVLVPALLSSDDQPTYRVATVGVGNEVLIDTANRLFAEYYAGQERHPTVRSQPFMDRAQAEAELERGEVEAVLVDAYRLLVNESGSEIERVLQDAARTLALSELLEAGQPEAVALLTQPNLELETQVSTNEQERETRRGVVAYGASLLMYVAILTYGSWLLTGVTEEKTTRVVEVLLAVVKPWQLLAGKVAGIGLLGLSQFSVTVVSVLVAIRITGVFELPEVSLALYPSLFLWFILGYALYSVGFAAAGALVSRTEDAQNASFPLTMVALVSLLGSLWTLNNPASLLSRVATWLPPSAPFVVPIRQATDNIELWEFGVAVVISLLFTIGLIRLASRVYAGGLLRFGGRVKIREAFSATQEN